MAQAPGALTPEPHMDSTTPMGCLRNIFGSVAGFERELIRERI